METATVPVPSTLVTVIERRRAGSVPPRGMPFVERRRPAPVFVTDADDLHAADHDALVADALDYGFAREAAVGAAQLLAGLIGPAAFAAHDLRPAAAADLAC